MLARLPRLTTILTLVVLLAAPLATAWGDQLARCDEYDQATCDDGLPALPPLVTGHTIYTYRVAEHALDGTVTWTSSSNTASVPQNLAPGGPADVDVHETTGAVQQRECVVWLDGHNLDFTPNPDLWGADNHFPSDEDQAVGVVGDEAFQDYDFDADVSSCAPEVNVDLGGSLGLPTDFAAIAGFFVRNEFRSFDPVNNSDPTWGHDYGDFVVVTERGDCDPADGSNFRFRGHLDFIDPNGVYHEVQEYDYNCLADIPLENRLCDDSIFLDQFTREITALNIRGRDFGDPDGDGQNITTPAIIFGGAGAGDWGCNSDPGLAPVGASATSAAIRSLLPWTYTDAHNEHGCNQDDAAAPEPIIDLGHKCNGTIQDIFSERLWITRTHHPVHDGGSGQEYTFALIADTCSSLSIHEQDGRAAAKARPRGYAGEAHPPFSTLRETFYGFFPDSEVANPFGQQCTDGSSASFDDTDRRWIIHHDPPGNLEEMNAGNSFGLRFDGGFGHRQDERFVDHTLEDSGWPLNFLPTPGFHMLGYPEDHGVADMDVRIYDFDPTGVFEARAVTIDWADSSGEGRAPGT